MKQMRSVVVAVLMGAMGFGCEKSSTKSTDPVVPYAVSAQTVARVHWLGKKKIAASTNSASLMKIWNEPESARLGAQTLDKLSTAPWRLIPGVATTNTDAAPLLRALLDDCVEEESYLEIRHVTNQPAEIAFAIRLPADRAALWQTNLAAVLKSLTGIEVSNSQLPSPGFQLRKHEQPDLIEFTRAEDWVVIGLGHEKNTLLSDFTARIFKGHTPYTGGGTDVWVNAEVDLRDLSEALHLGWQLPANFPKVSVAMAGNHEIVATRGSFYFPAPLNLDLHSWQVPLGLIRPPLSSFIAIRGLQPFLNSLKLWNDLQLGAVPNQAFCWALDGAPQMTFFAVPFSEASNRVAQASDQIMNRYGAEFSTNETFSFEKAQDGVGLSWTGTPFLAPYLQAANTPEGEFAFVGFFPNRPISPVPVPEALLHELSSRTNLVYYDWDNTSRRVESLLYVGQFFRFVTHHAQLPEGASLAWLNAVATNLGPTVTEVTQASPNELVLLRSSSCGFSAVELHLLADWMESPQFPVGFNTFAAPPPPRRGRLPLKQQENR